MRSPLWHARIVPQGGDGSRSIRRVQMTGKQIACSLMDEYEARLAPARLRFDQHPAVAALFRERLEPATLEAFLIYFSALGVGMTEPVEGWIRRAGRRCQEVGLPKLAKAL